MPVSLAYSIKLAKPEDFSLPKQYNQKSDI